MDLDAMHLVYALLATLNTYRACLFNFKDRKKKPYQLRECISCLFAIKNYAVILGMKFYYVPCVVARPDPEIPLNRDSFLI